MRLAISGLALVGALAMTGCSTLVSLNPFTTDKEAIVDPRLVGVWSVEDDLCAISQDGNAYAVKYMGNDAPVKFQARLFKVGDATLMDLVSTDDHAFQVPVHAAVRVWIEDATLRWAFLDSDWLKEQVNGKLPTQEESAKDRTVLSAPRADVRAFLVKYGSDGQAYSKIQEFHKVQ